MASFVPIGEGEGQRLEAGKEQAGSEPLLAPWPPSMATLPAGTAPRATGPRCLSPSPAACTMFAYRAAALSLLLPPLVRRGRLHTGATWLVPALARAGKG